MFGKEVGIDWSLSQLSQYGPWQFIGTKVQELRFELFEADVNFLLCTSRTPASWLSHPSTFQAYNIKANAISVACDYVLFIDKAIKKGAHLFSLEALYADPDSWPIKLASIIPNWVPASQNWWEHMDANQDHFKASANWLRAHPSATRQPEDYRQPLNFKPGTAIDEVFGAFESLNTTGRPVPLTVEKRAKLEALRKLPGKSIEDLVISEDPLLASLLSPPPLRISLQDRIYSKFFRARWR